MLKQIWYFVGFAGTIATIPLLSMIQTQAQTGQPNFQGRGVAQGAAFTRGRNANATLTLNQDNFFLEFQEPGSGGARVQYRGNVVRQPNASATNFTIDGRVRAFDSSLNPRIINNTTGTCRIEVFDARIISSNCRTASANSNLQFLGLEQF